MQRCASRLTLCLPCLLCPRERTDLLIMRLNVMLAMSGSNRFARRSLDVRAGTSPLCDFAG